MTTATLTGVDKPLLRGMSHLFAFFAFLFACAILFAAAAPGLGRRAVLVYGASACFLYGTSALYHRRRWTEEGARRMQRVDHSAIFVLIAGSYSPLFMLFPGDGNPLLLVWAFAGLGVLKALVWPRSPTWINALLAIGVGWCGAGHVLSLGATMGTAALVLIVSAGVTYTVGGVIYALRKPDPLPRIFGYHEVFHALVITAGIAHFWHVVLLLNTVGAL